MLLAVCVCVCPHTVTAVYYEGKIRQVLAELNGTGETARTKQAGDVALDTVGKLALGDKSTQLPNMPGPFPCLLASQTAPTHAGIACILPLTECVKCHSTKSLCNHPLMTLAALPGI